MRPSSLVMLECRAALAGPRAVGVRLGGTLLLGLPFAVVDLPVRAAAGGLAALVLFVGLFGATVAQVRRREDGRADRLRLLPQPRWLLAADGCLAGAAVDLLQVALPLALYLAVRAPGLGSGLGPLLGQWLALTGLAAAALVALNALGALLAAAARSGAEAHLFGALGSGFVALGSGLVPVPGRLEGLVGVAAAWSPVGSLAGALEAAGQGVSGPWVPGVALLALFCAALGGRASGRNR